jgi:hypothetical protein
MSDQPTYRFRHSNVDLETYIENMRFRATFLRREAATKISQAEVIEDEADRLSRDLDAVEGEGTKA